MLLELEEIKPQDLEKNSDLYRNKLLANLVPRDLEALQQLEQRIVQNPQNAQLKVDHRSMLLGASTAEFV
jgi:hypothetical protein